MAQAQPSDAHTYVLGQYGREELDRLINQGRFVGDLTEHVLRLAGLAPGMRVLDVGCGAGDVSFLAAQLVGPSGTVVGVDKASAAIDAARARARGAGLENVHFIVEDANDLALDAQMDALIGRLVLAHFAEPSITLRRLLRNLRSGGIVAFQEADLGSAVSEPRCPLFEATLERIGQTVARTGNDPRVGIKLRRIYQAAGLPAPQMLQMAWAEGGPDSPLYALLEQLTRSALPAMERVGIASAEEVQVDTLATRMRAEAVDRDAVLVFPLIGAWARTNTGWIEER